MPIPSYDQMYNALAQRHGAQLQEKFSAASVAVCGLGGLGSNIAIHLARAGIGTLSIIDFDCVDISNLNRQQYFPDQLGMPKSQALYDTLRRIAPYCRITAHNVKLNEVNIPQLLNDSDIIIEAFDNAEAKAMLVNTVLESFPDKFLIAGSGMAGMGSANSIVTRKVMNKFYLCGDGVSDVSGGLGLVAPRVAVCAAHQAHMALRIIAGDLDV